MDPGTEIALIVTVGAIASAAGASIMQVILQKGIAEQRARERAEDRTERDEVRKAAETAAAHAREAAAEIKSIATDIKSVAESAGAAGELRGRDFERERGNC